MTPEIIDRAGAETIVTTGVKKALESGATEAAAVLNANISSLSRFAVNRMTQNLERRTTELAIAVAVGKQECTLRGNPTDEESIANLARRCVENARLFNENDEHLPPVAPQPLREINGYDPEIAALSPKEKAQVIYDICTTAKQKNLTSYGTFKNEQRVYAVANSSGTLAYYPETEVAFSLTSRTECNTGSGREHGSETWLKNLDTRKIAATAIDKALLSKKPRELKPGDYTVILSPTAVANYLSYMVWALDARLAETGRSPLSRFNNGNTLLGEKIFADSVTIKLIADNPDTPVLPFGAAPSFEGPAGQGMTTTLFSDGLPAENTTIVKDGVLQNLLYSYYWATHKGVAPKAFPHFLCMDGNSGSLDDLISETERGIFVSSLWYIRFVDKNTLLLTGLTRDGTFYVENGKIQYPIKNFRFNESPIESLKNVEALSQPEKRTVWGFKMQVPGMRVRNFTFSSVSDAI